MEGETSGKHAGVISRSIHQIFTYLEAHCTEYTVRVSHLELYNEELHDLLGDSLTIGKPSTGPDPNKLRLYDGQDSGVHVHGLEWRNVTNAEDVIQILVPLP